MSRKKIKNVPNNSFTEFLLYTTPGGNVKVEILLKDENIWLTQDRIAKLFGVQRPAIRKHLKNIYESGELQEEVVSSIMELSTVPWKGKLKPVLSNTGISVPLSLPVIASTSG